MCQLVLVLPHSTHILYFFTLYYFTMALIRFILATLYIIHFSDLHSTSLFFTLPRLCFILLDPRSLYDVSTSFYFTLPWLCLIHFTVLYFTMALLHSTMALLHSTIANITLPTSFHHGSASLYMTLLHCTTAPLYSTPIYYDSTLLYDA